VAARGAMTAGFLLGKFLPPHRGHQLLCDTALAMTSQLTILVCSLPDDPILGEVRHRWMAAMYPAARVLHLAKVVPQAPEESPDFWPIWRDLVRGYHPEPIDLVFASDSYGARLALELGARWVPVDTARDAMPIAASAIRADPVTHWGMLSEIARPWYAKRLVLCGAESTGKSTLARQLARHFHTVALPEYGRTWCEAFGLDLQPVDLNRIAAGHIATREAALRHVDRVLIEDTDIVMTSVWAEMLFGARDPELEAIAATGDRYLLLDTDVPWQDDGTRFFGDVQQRARFQQLTEAALARRGIEPVLVSGDSSQRFATAQAVVRALIAPRS